MYTTAATSKPDLELDSCVWGIAFTVYQIFHPTAGCVQMRHPVCVPPVERKRTTVSQEVRRRGKRTTLTTICREVTYDTENDTHGYLDFKVEDKGNMHVKQATTGSNMMHTSSVMSDTCNFPHEHVQNLDESQWIVRNCVEA